MVAMLAWLIPEGPWVPGVLGNLVMVTLGSSSDSHGRISCNMLPKLAKALNQDGVGDEVTLYFIY